MDREFERLRYKTAVILQDPDFIIYDSLVQYRIQELEVECVSNFPSLQTATNGALLPL